MWNGFKEAFGKSKKIRQGRDLRKDVLPGAEKKKTFFLYTDRAKFSVIVILFLALTYYILLPESIFYSISLHVGDTVQEDIISPVELDINDKAATGRLKEETRLNQPAVFDFDKPYIVGVKKKTGKAFVGMRQFLSQFGSGTEASPENTDHQLPDKNLLAEQEKKFQINLGIPLSDKTMKTLSGNKYSVELEKNLITIMEKILANGIVASKTLPGITYKGILLKGVRERTEKKLDNLNSLLDQPTAKKNLEIFISETYAESPALKEAVSDIATQLVVPNITFSKSETERIRDIAESEVKALYFHIHKSEPILKAGSVVSAQDMLMLDQISKYSSRALQVQVMVGVFLIISMVMYIFYIDLDRYKPDLLKNFHQLFFLAILFSGTLLTSKFTYVVIRSFLANFPEIDPEVTFYALPIATGSILAVILFDIHTAIIFSFLISLLSGIFIHDSSLYVFYIFFGNIMAAFSAMDCKKRSGLIRAGFIVGMVNVMMMVSINLFNAELFTMQGLHSILFGFVGGLIVALASSFLLPVCETCFDITTNIKLLELSDLNQPILRNLLISAPGTYHHSMMVGTLAEEAAEGISENPLQARVACYYHDIGKTIKPAYYIENQVGILNRHDNLSPRMSSIIVTSHVKDGIDIALRAKLPVEILSIIKEHHGTRLIKFFFEKAKSSINTGDAPVAEEEYRYAGPRPQSKISGIIMMSDAIEACSRVLTDPSHSRIKTLVENVVTDIYNEKQLDESRLSITDLTKIKESFTKTLIGMFHRRINYPGVKYYEEAKDDDKNEGNAGNKEAGGKPGRRAIQTGGHGSVINIKRPNRSTGV